MEDHQNGFRDGRCVIDNIFALKIINEKLWAYNQSVQYLFIDVQKAYDSIDRDTVWECMKEFKIPAKLIICVKHVYKKQEVRLE